MITRKLSGEYDSPFHTRKTVSSHSFSTLSVVVLIILSNYGTSTPIAVIKPWLATRKCEKSFRLNIYLIHIPKFCCSSYYVYDLQYDDDKVISCSAHPDNTIRIWDLATGKCRKILSGHSHYVYCLQYDEEKIVRAVPLNNKQSDPISTQPTPF